MFQWEASVSDALNLPTLVTVTILTVRLLDQQVKMETSLSMQVEHKSLGSLLSWSKQKKTFAISMKEKRIDQQQRHLEVAQQTPTCEDFGLYSDNTHYSV